jgi:hypothetical protein
MSGSLVVAASSVITLLAAVVAGVFGFASGAAAAAVITTNHERAESFRRLMVEAAKDYLTRVVAAESALRTIGRDAERLEYAAERDELEQEGEFNPEIYGITTYLPPPVSRTWEQLSASLDGARELIAEAESAVPQLLVLFPDPEVGRHAAAVVGDLGGWHASLTDAVTQRRFFLSRGDERHDPVGSRAGTYYTDRRELLEALNENIWRRRLGRVRARDPRSMTR